MPADSLDDSCFGDEEGAPAPFDPASAAAGAPCPPGGFCGAGACREKTQFYVQRWTCVWAQAPEQRAWTKAWRCSFLPVERREVLRALCRRPRPEGRCGGERDCVVPEDAYFAKVFEVEYFECSELLDDAPSESTGAAWEGSTPAVAGDAAEKSSHASGPPAGCCGLAEAVVPRWVRIHCKSQIPPDFPCEAPLPYYERPAERRSRRPGTCAGAPRGAGGPSQCKCGRGERP
jgi:hypothetical protein